MKSINVIHAPRKKSKLNQAKIKEHLEFSMGVPIRLLMVKRFEISDSIRGKTIENIYVIYDRPVALSKVDSDLRDYREIRYAVFEDGASHGGGILG